MTIDIGCKIKNLGGRERGRISCSNFMSHKFEAEMTSQGWIGVNLKLKEEYTVPMSMVIWIVSPNALTIDKYHQIEKINLQNKIVLYILFGLLFYVYGLLFTCLLFENVPLSVIQSDKGTSDVDPFIPINRP